MATMIGPRFVPTTLSCFELPLIIFVQCIHLYPFACLSQCHEEGNFSSTNGFIRAVKYGRVV